MTPEIQTLVALGVVVGALVYLARSFFGRKSSGCGGSCGAVSRDARKFRAKLHR